MALPMRTILCIVARNAVSHHRQRYSQSILLQYTTHKRLFCSETSNSAGSTNTKSFDESLLKVLVCPLSKQPLRYDREKNELVSESIGVAYSITNGIPNLVPQDGRVLNKDKELTND